MPAHRVEADLRLAQFTESTVKLLERPAVRVAPATRAYLIGAGATVPVDGTAGFGKGAIFLETGTGKFYRNSGTSASAAFKAIVAVLTSTAFVQTYSTADPTLAAYTADSEAIAYTGAADGEAKLADLNALRVAYENLRAFTEDAVAMLNSVVDNMQANGLAT